jgi:NADP-dependent aldehyde dehydrogenase
VPADAGFEEALCDALGPIGAHRLLTDGIDAAFATGAARLGGLDRAEVVWRGAADEGVAPATVIATDATALAADAEAWLRECFGPLTVLVRYEDRAELDEAITALEGGLTASIHHAPART